MKTSGSLLWALMKASELSETADEAWEGVREGEPIDLTLLRGCHRHPEPAEPWRDRLGLPAEFMGQGFRVQGLRHTYN